MAQSAAQLVPDPRGRILEAARQLFAERGSDEVTMAEVAGAAGVARATVFNHFGSKHALIEAITEQVLAGYQTLLEQWDGDRETPTPEIVRSLFETIGRGVEQARHFHRAVFREIAKAGMGLDEGGPGQRSRQANLQGMTQLMLRGQARGELNREHRAEDLGSAFGAIVYGTITHWLYDDASEPLPERMRRAAEVFLDGAAAREATRRKR
jgi:AcrR family transcriptional regulator